MQTKEEKKIKSADKVKIKRNSNYRSSTAIKIQIFFQLLFQTKTPTHYSQL